jgi:hypothetical protein
MGSQRAPRFVLAELLAVLRAAPGVPGEDEIATATRLLEKTTEGRGLVGYLSEEAGLLALAAHRLNASGDEELRDMGRALGQAAERLRLLAGQEGDPAG